MVIQEAERGRRADRVPIQIGEHLLRARRNRAVDAIVSNHLRNLLRRALVQIEPDIRVPAAEFTDDAGQNIPRLGMCRTYGQAAPALIAQLRERVDRIVPLQE